MTNTFITLRKQAAVGCDYTIACGKDYKIEESDLDLESFVKTKVLESFFGDENADPEEYGEVDGDSMLDEMFVIHLESGNKHEVDLDYWVTYFREYNQEKEDEAVRQEELALLERLKNKYEK